MMRLIAAAVVMFAVQAVPFSSADADQLNHTQRYKIISSTMPSDGKLIRMPSNVTPEQYIKTHPRPVVTVMVAPQPVVTQEKKSDDLATVRKWVDTLQHADGITVPASSRLTREDVEWQYAVQRLKNRSREDQITGVNDLLNKVPYVTDTKNYGTKDYWATPAEFVTHGGDCEDYAIAKYASLRALGIPADQMHISIVKNKENMKDTTHAILVVHTGNGDVVLDNAGQNIEKADSVRKYKPLMSIDSRDWSLYTDKKNP